MKRKLLFAFMSVVLMFSFVYVLVSCGDVEKNDNPDTSETEDIYYTVTFKDYDGTVLQSSSVKEGKMPTYNKSNPTRKSDENYSYTFSGWSPSIKAVNGDTTYIANYTSKALSYNVVIDLDGGTSNTTKLQFKTDKMSKDLLPFDVKKEGYAFKGYSLNNVKVYDEKGSIVNNYNLSSNMTFKAIYEESVTLTIKYTMYNPNTGSLIETYKEKPTDLGNVSETRSYKYNTYVDLFAYANEGYTFVGWYSEGQVLSNEKDYKYMMWDQDFTIEARFKYKLYDLNVWSNDADLGSVMIKNGNSQIYYTEETLKEYYTQKITIAAYTKTDTVSFLGWYNEENALVSTNAIYTFNMLNRDYKLEAKWNKFSITYDANEGVNNSSNPNTYNIDMQDITLLSPTRVGYTFGGWEYNGEVITKIKTSNACHMSLKALWTVNTNTAYKVEHYKQNINNNNYTLYETDDLEGTTDTLTSGSVKTYVGFTSPETITQVNIDGDGSTVIKLYYTRNSYSVNLSKNIEKAGSVSGSGSYKYEKEATITATTNEGYTFIGWYEGDTLYTNDLSFTLTITEPKTFEARYSVNKYTITLDNQASDVTISGITSGSKYEYGTQITLTATNNSGLYVKWQVNGVIKHYGNEYTFAVPSKEVTITTTTTPYTREDNKIYFGKYPQTKVEDDTLISSLNDLAGEKPTSANMHNWTSYKYYISGSVEDYMFYQDIDIDSDGSYDYRGVYFTSYRPYNYSSSSSSSNTYQNENGYSTNTIYWFSYDPIEWDVLTESNGKALIIANLILDSQEYYPSASSSSFSHNGGTGYANNYELSAIRKFLNDNFYNTAFNDLEKSIIETTNVDNSASSTGYSSNSYACNNTNDKMFLLSYKEATTYFSSYTARKAKGTDYAKCQGLYVNSSSYSYWWLRSPSSYDASIAQHVNHGGGISDFHVLSTDYGVRPACYINLG